ncbi:unnamed protein product [Fusarium equiseti]|uniref:NIMA interactive protein n=1 Tax=Fusarium equiseti TaxID=61235 RepID=A0A8J2IGW3_FUSEQ|nr:unnamed protein product [Fusarium equiseti]
MIDTDNLRTASLYINNQLLSRGLLRDGQSIDFAGAAFDGHDAAATMGRIRDAEHRESLSTTMRTLRADNLKHTNDIARLTEKHNEAKRKLDIAEASEAALKTQMKSADAAIRGLKEEVARTKGLVAQARAACATDVRRRDRQIDTLKKQLTEAGRARGARSNPGVTSITITGDIGDDRTSSTRGARTSTDDYSLRNETNAFLANLAQNLSEENEAILVVMRKTMKQLRDMSGWNNDNQDTLVTQQQGWQDMATELDSVLEHMRTILTNPSFVPIEEVMVREEEISRLKDGWVKMESRWTEAVHLIDGWRKRMAANGRPICDEELQMGLRLSPVRVRDVEETRHASGLRLSAVAEEEEEEDEEMHNSPCPSRCSPSVQLVPESEPEDDGHGHESDAESDYDVPIDDYDVDEPNVQILQQSTAAPLYHREQESSPLPEPPQLSPLKDSASAGNRGSHRPKQPGKRDFTTIAEEDSWDHAGQIDPTPIKFNPEVRDRVSSSSSLDEVLLKSSNVAPPEAKPTTPSRQSSQRSDQNEANPGSPNRSPRRTASRLPLPRNVDPVPQQSPLTMATIAAKLAASERDADAARVRAKLRAARSARGVKKPNITPSEPQAAESPAKESELKRSGLENVDPVKRDPAPADGQLKPEKRRRGHKTSKSASRRRSTLSPWELESLMNGNVQ